jgi:hypothetical protein
MAYIDTHRPTCSECRARGKITQATRHLVVSWDNERFTLQLCTDHAVKQLDSILAGGQDCDIQVSSIIGTTMEDRNRG